MKCTCMPAAGAGWAQAHLLLPWLWELVCHPAVVAAAAEALGGVRNLLCWSSDIFVKEPGDGGYTSWHQDSTYVGEFVCFSRAARAGAWKYLGWQMGQQLRCRRAVFCAERWPQEDGRVRADEPAQELCEPRTGWAHTQALRGNCTHPLIPARRRAQASARPTW